MPEEPQHDGGGVRTTAATGAKDLREQKGLRRLQVSAFRIYGCLGSSVVKAALKKVLLKEVAWDE